MDSERSVRVRGKIPFRVIEGEAVLVKVKSGEVVHLNQTGAFIWECLSQEESLKLSELVTRVIEEFGVESDTAQDDVAAFIRELETQELIESV